MINKQLVLGAVMAVGGVLALSGPALAFCEGPRDPQFSSCSEDGTSGQMTNGFFIIVDLANGSSAEGHSFDDQGDEIFVCFIEDTEVGLGNRSNTAELNCAFDVAEVQVVVN